ncbi:MAG TPA: NAD(P)H-dependent oxidoreductase [Kiritimatiellia bacterium]|nr:NAD(P)H-dependent oxidoreductase [Kiritimatiellia bacterium]
MNILHICANPKPTEESVSKQLAASFFITLANEFPDYTVENVDLYQSPPPYISYDAWRGFYLPVYVNGYHATDKEVAATNYARKQGKLFNAADVLVLTTPMWNYNMPAILKAWFDQVLSPGITYEVEKTGPKPLHSIKKVVLLVASGGTYKEDDPADALGRGVAAALKFIGITDISVAWADGQNPLYFDNSETRKQMALEAVQEIAEEVAEMAAEF